MSTAAPPPSLPRVIAARDYPADLAPEKLRQYAGTGVAAYLTANSCKPFMLGWYGGDRFDPRDYVGEIAKLVRRQPAIRLLLQVGTLSGAAPLRWCQEHPDELARRADGSHPRLASFASAPWQRDSREAIRRFVGHFERSP